MNSKNILTLALLLSATAAYAKQSVVIQNLTPYSGTWKTYVQSTKALKSVGIGKDSKTKKLPARIDTHGAKTGEFKPSKTKFTVYNQGDLFNKVKVTLDIKQGTNTITRTVTYSLRGPYAVEDWDFIIFEDPKTDEIKLCSQEIYSGTKDNRTWISAIPTAVAEAMTAEKGDIALRQAGFFGGYCKVIFKK